jgi:subtilisin family serine protease
MFAITITEVMRKPLTAFACAVVGLVALTGPSASSAPVAQPWQLDRINQRTLPLDTDSSFGALTGEGITIYIVDSGTNLSHEQFAGRALVGVDILTPRGRDPVSPLSSDCDGHGTHVAALAAGATVGVARGATIVSVRVLDCDGEGDVSDVVTALKWIRGHHVGGRAAVVNLSLGVDRGDQGQSIDDQVNALLNEGVVVTIAAGNSDAYGRYNSCDISPAHVPRALTVGATAINDAFTTYSGYGPCVDVLAPGGTSSAAIESAWIGDAAAYELDAGTSMASPLVAGYAALLAQQQPGLCADDISDAIVARATSGEVTAVDALTANRLLFVDTAPVAAGLPGQPSNVVLTTGGGSLGVSWDAPCDGGSPITSTRVALVRNGTVVKKVTVGPGITSMRFTNLPVGAQYSVVVKAANALGEGIATPRHTGPKVRNLRANSYVSITSIAKIGGDLSLKWRVSAGSSRICRLTSGGTKVHFMRSGTCRVALRTITDGPAVARNLRVS